MNTEAREQLDAAVLDSLAARSDIATYVIRNTLDWPGKPWHKKGLLTAHVLRACRRLERAGLVVEIPTSYAVMKTWRITDAARAAISSASEPRL